MAVTKILAKRTRLDVMLRYAIDGDKTQEQVLTAYHNCWPKNPYGQMMETKREMGKLDGVQGYHIIQSFADGEVTPELALEIARQFTEECLPEYQAVIGVHTNTGHIHAHIIFNSVNFITGQKYHSNAQSYYQQIRAISDRVCKEHGLKIIMAGEKSHGVHYYEWLREQSGQPTFQGMLAMDLKRAIEDANDYGHFLMLMEHMGYEVKHGNRLSFRIRGQEQWMVPGRRDPLFTEDGIRKAIQGNMEAIEAGLRPVLIARRPYAPYRKHPKHTGFMALYVHYLYLLGKIKKQEYPPKMSPHLKAEIMKFEKYKAQFRFLHENNISGPEQLAAHRAACEERLAALTKHRTILNARKKKCKPLYDALADAEALRPAMDLYAQGMTGMEDEAARYMDAVDVLEKSGVPLEQLKAEKAAAYEAVAEVNRDIRAIRKQIALCDEIIQTAPAMQKQIDAVTKEPREKNVQKER